MALVERAGAALPLFIKWDDAEFGLRAAALGVPTVTLPGAALWHMPWTGKDDGLDWQAYHQLRNRLVAALIHSESPRGDGVLSASFMLDVNHVLCMQYGSAAARRVALRDILRGPSHLAETIQQRTGDIRDLLSRAGQIVIPESALPQTRGGPIPEPPHGIAQAASRLVRVLIHQLRRPQPDSAVTVDRRLTRDDGKWWALGLLDSATVESATGVGAFVGRRRRGTAAALLRDAVGLRVRLWLAWPNLSAAYRAAVPELTSPEAWISLFLRSVDAEGRSSERA